MNVTKRIARLEAALENLLLKSPEFDYEGTHPEALKARLDAMDAQLEELQTTVNQLKLDAGCPDCAARRLIAAARLSGRCYQEEIKTTEPAKNEHFPGWQPLK